MAKSFHIDLDQAAQFFISYIFKPTNNVCGVFPLVYIGTEYQDFIDFTQ